MSATYSAPWSRTLQTSTVVVFVLAICMIFLVWNAVPESPSWLRYTGFGMLLICGACSPWIIRGYSIEPGRVIVHRLLWRNVVELGGLEDVQEGFGVISGSIRVAGIGGVFVFSGWFWNRELGRHRMFATDPNRAVTLTFTDKRPVVFTPDNPGDFAREVRRAARSLN